MEKVKELLGVLRELYDIDDRTEEMRKKFIEVFGIEPTDVTVFSAKKLITMKEMDDETLSMVGDLVYKLRGEYPRCVEIYLEVQKEPQKVEKDWLLFEYRMGMFKYADGYSYAIQIMYETDDSDP